ncbi:MAG: hypothetical protein A2086_02515 [Spirochaetes bacterium GWD1_27_9]|nr:MAG: hypothetical protein A2Z98_01120 [Spirochaetes bacterium GWB1_27_13]OHD35891.1 MAG: hypothetical protein A2086_02515 [Spirochaetes bacterium GWD1_27_9]
MSDNNFFLKTYKKNQNQEENKKEDKKQPFIIEEEKPKIVKKVVFEKLEQKLEKEEKEKKVLPPIPKKRLAALFLVLCGIEKSKEIIKNFNEEELIKTVSEILAIESISKEEIEQVEKNFGKISNIDGKAKGGKEFARNLLQKSFGISKGSEFFIKTIEEEKDKEFKFLQELSEEQLKDILKDESDLVAALIMGMLPPQKAAKIMSLLPKEMTVKVIKKMSGKFEINTEVMNIIIKKLKEKAKNIKTDENIIKIAGKNKLLEILKHSDPKSAELLLDELAHEDEELANEIKENIFTFNDVALLKKKDLEKALKNYNDKDLAFILKGAKEEIKTIFFTCITKRRKELIEEEIKVMGEVRKKDVDDKRRAFIDFLKEMEAKGEISLSPDTEIYVK